MNIRCLIGHDYGDTQTSREREERGDEVVVTAVEYRECSRCGDRRIVSENKEVTSIGTEPADADADGSAGEETGVAPDADAREERGVPDADAREERGVPEYEDVSAEEDDGIILEDDPETGERAHGEWPAEPSGAGEEGGEPREWPEVEGEDEGYAAAADDGDPAEDVEFGGGLAPDSGRARPADGEGDGDREETGTTADAPGIRSSDSAPSPARQRSPGADTEFVCPECGYTASPEESSLRPGDICPDCHEGYLAERETAAGE